MPTPCSKKDVRYKIYIIFFFFREARARFISILGNLCFFVPSWWFSCSRGLNSSLNRFYLSWSCRRTAQILLRWPRLPRRTLTAEPVGVGCCCRSAPGLTICGTPRTPARRSVLSASPDSINREKIKKKYIKSRWLHHELSSKKTHKIKTHSIYVTISLCRFAILHMIYTMHETLYITLQYYCFVNRTTPLTRPRREKKKNFERGFQWG